MEVTLRQEIQSCDENLYVCIDNDYITVGDGKSKISLTHEEFQEIMRLHGQYRKIIAMTNNDDISS